MFKIKKVGGVEKYKVTLTVFGLTLCLYQAEDKRTYTINLSATSILADMRLGDKK